MTDELTTTQTVAVTGATGYVGGRLVPRLLDRGYRVRCLVRSPEKLVNRDWYDHPQVQVVACNLEDDSTAIAEALAGCQIAYYLVHSMVTAGDDFANRDKRLATNFAGGAESAGLKRIVYLGGLGETGKDLSEHLASRREVEQVLRDSGVPVTVFRAAVILGSGSASFEILRYLSARLPVMITPKWVQTECQPIAIRDVLQYLTDCLEVPGSANEAIDIGGPDVLTYGQLIKLMAERQGLGRRIIIPVPLLTPELSSRWIHLVTPVDAKLARPLAQGLRNRVVVRNDAAERLFDFDPLPVSEAIDRSLGKHRAGEVETSWSGAGALPAEPTPGDPDWSGGTLFEDTRTIQIDAPAPAVFAAVCRIGGSNGWYTADILWRIRGIMDLFAGGPGLRRGKRIPDTVRLGEALDFWRVIAIDENRRLKLLAEMKLPGVATLEFNIEPKTTGASALTMSARFRPRGLFGLLYWYAVLPAHGIVFKGMLKGIRRRAEECKNAEITAEPVRGSTAEEANAG